MRRTGFILMLVLLLTSIMAIKYEEETLRIPHPEQGFTEEYGVELVYPQFQSDEHSKTLSLINGQIVELNNDMCALYKSDEKILGPGKLRNEYEIAFLTEDFISLVLSYTFDFSPTYEEVEEGVHSYVKTSFYNFDLRSGNNLLPQDCFRFIGNEQEWAEFVVNNDECMNNNSFPTDFMCDSSSIGLQFEGCEDVAMFPWEDLKPFFEVKGLDLVKN